MATKPTTTTKKSSRATKAPKPAPRLSETLRTVPAIEGIEELRRLHQRYGLIPVTAMEEIDTHLARLETVLAENAVSALDLATNHALIISMLTGVPRKEITDPKASDVAESLHIYRNLCLATAVLAANTIKVTSAATQPEAVYAHAVKLSRRSILIRRPFADDEIVLCRVAAHLRAFADPRDHTSTIYTLLDAGLVPGETTEVRIEDFDDREMPQELLAAGNGHLDARHLDLDQFATLTLGRHLEHALRAGHSPQAPLTYKPRTPKEGKEKHEPGSTSATASAQRIIDRFLEQLGLPTGDITASSITQWRVATTLATQGAEAALEISGRTNLDAMYRALGSTTAISAPRTDDVGVTFAA